VRRILLAAGGAFAVGAIVLACSAKAKAVAAGGECMLAVDCEPGLVCVPQRDGRRICDSDLSGVQRLYDAGRAPVDANREGGEGGEGGETDGAPPRDAGEPETAADAPSE
jgi:hypothetical protein